MGRLLKTSLSPNPGPALALALILTLTLALALTLPLTLTRTRTLTLALSPGQRGGAHRGPGLRGVYATDPITLTLTVAQP